MKKPSKKNFDGAERMQQVAAKIIEAMKNVAVDIVAKELPEAEDPHNEARQVGALVTAITGLYADMLETTVASDGPAEARLVADMLRTLVAEPLQRVAKLADRKD
jgi:hypothetical protein